MERVTVPIPGRSYDVTIGAGVIEGVAEHLPEFPRASQAFVIGDRTVSDAWFAPLAEALLERNLGAVLLGVPSGEAA